MLARGFTRQRTTRYMVRGSATAPGDRSLLLALASFGLGQYNALGLTASAPDSIAAGSMERETRLELATSTLEGSRSTN